MSWRTIELIPIFIAVQIALVVGLSACLLCLLLSRLWRWLPCLVAWLIVLGVVAYRTRQTDLGSALRLIFFYGFPVHFLAIISSLGASRYSLFPAELGYKGVFLTLLPLSIPTVLGTLFLSAHLTSSAGDTHIWFSLVGAFSPSLAVLSVFQLQKFLRDKQ
jgi:hypothetical protein